MKEGRKGVKEGRKLVKEGSEGRKKGRKGVKEGRKEGIPFVKLVFFDVVEGGDALPRTRI